MARARRRKRMARMGREARMKAMVGMVAALAVAADVAAQEPAAWGAGGELVFHTFSIAAIDPATGESGVAVTTRNACVGNGVPWVRAGVGAVATQAATRTEYGYELLDLMEEGVSPEEALAERLAADDNAASRQIGVIGVDGRSAQHTGTRSQWAGHRAGPGYVAQGNTLVGPEVIDAVGDSFESTEGAPRHLADRLIEALRAGHLVGGDARHGEAQSAAVIVADPRPRNGPPRGWPDRADQRLRTRRSARRDAPHLRCHLRDPRLPHPAAGGGPRRLPTQADASRAGPLPARRRRRLARGRELEHLHPGCRGRRGPLPGPRRDGAPRSRDTWTRPRSPACGASWRRRDGRTTCGGGCWTCSGSGGRA